MRLWVLMSWSVEAVGVDELVVDRVLMSWSVEAVGVDELVS